MTELIKGGRLRTAGVSNFQPAHLDRIVAATGLVPAVNQIEVHPYFTNDAARAGSIRHGVVVEAHSPLGHGQGRLLDDTVIRRVAAARNKTSAQIVLRWHLQHGRIVFPKSVPRERMEENLKAFGFELSADEMALSTASTKVKWDVSGHIRTRSPRSQRRMRVRTSQDKHESVRLALSFGRGESSR